MSRRLVMAERDGFSIGEPERLSEPAAADVATWLRAQDVGPRPWRDGDERCHCTHCRSCGRLYRTDDIQEHREHCPVAKVLDAFKLLPEGGAA